MRSDATRRELTELQIQALFAAYRRAGDESARETLVRHFTPLVESVARQYRTYAEHFDDLRQEGMIGLVKAIEGYDIRRGVKFITYATHLIQGEVKHYLRDRTGIIREPGWLHEVNRKVSRAVEALTQEHGRQPTVSEIAEAAGVNESAVADVLRSRPTFRVASIDAAEEGNEGAGVDLDKLRRTEAPSLAIGVEERVELERALAKLRGLEREVLHYFYYLELSQTEIARRLGVSANHVSHLVRASAGKVRRILAHDEHHEVSLRVKAALEARRAHLEALRDPGAVDAITGLRRDAFLEDRLQEEVLRSRRYGHDLALGVLELEKLARYASSRTAVAGEQALKSVARIVQANIRKVDIATRYGQFGFGLLFPDTGEIVERVARRLVDRVSQARIGAHTPHAQGLRARAGVAVFPADALTAEELIAAARIALSAAGANGEAVVSAWTLDLPPKPATPEETPPAPRPRKPRRRPAGGGVGKAE